MSHIFVCIWCILVGLRYFHLGPADVDCIADLASSATEVTTTSDETSVPVAVYKKLKEDYEYVSPLIL